MVADWGPTTSRQGHSISRGLDFVLALGALVALAPLLVLLASMIKFQDGGPVFYPHTRLGRGGARFGCLKFRTMCVDAPERLASLLANSPRARAEWLATHKLKADPRVTPLGRFLRNSSLDELPQLLNVLRGDMSLVGPRPIVEGEIGYYGELFELYCQVRPGITGLWQVSGRSDTTYTERVALDAQYVRSKCLALDLEILLKTIPAVVQRKGAY